MLFSLEKTVYAMCHQLCDKHDILLFWHGNKTENLLFGNVQQFAMQSIIGFGLFFTLEAM
jgi:hypothetical protein